MALCCAHTAAGYLAYEAVRPAGGHRLPLLVAAVVLANGPDLDFVPGILLGHPGAYHRGVTHTVLASVVVALVAALAVRLAGRGRAPWLRAGAWAGAVWGSHLLLDFLTVDAVPPYGARFLWPFSDAFYLAPVTPLSEIIIDPASRGGFFRSLVAPHTAGVWVEEVSLLALTVLVVHLVRAGQTRAGWRDLPERS